MAGVFIRERMFRVGKELPITVVSPQAWFPGQTLIRLARPGYRITGDIFEVQQGVEIYRPRALCLPGICRQWDGYAMALAALPVVRRLKQEGRCDIIDAHFAYPDGYAASLLGKWLGLPYTITMRGTEPKHLRAPALRDRILAALRGAARLRASSPWSAMAWIPMCSTRCRATKPARSSGSRWTRRCSSPSARWSNARDFTA
jgi:hypothetical protein